MFIRATSGAHDPSGDHVFQRNGAEKQVNMTTQLIPQIMGDTAAAVIHTALGLTFAACNVDAFIDRRHDIENADFLGRPGQ